MALHKLSVLQQARPLDVARNDRLLRCVFELRGWTGEDGDGDAAFGRSASSCNGDSVDADTGFEIVGGKCIGALPCTYYADAPGAEGACCEDEAYEDGVGAATKEDYLRRVSSMPPVIFSARRLSVGLGEVDVKQNQKDFQRDRLLVNGLHISGAVGGYDAAVAAVSGALRGLCGARSMSGRGTKSQAAAFLSSSRSEAAWTEKARERAAQLLLSLLGRTCSGFATFEEMLRHYGAREGEPTVLAPQSAAATPLELVVDRGGVVGRAHTRFMVLDLNDFGEPLFTVDGVFAFHIEAAALRRLVASDEPFLEREKKLQKDSRGEAPLWPAEQVMVKVMLQRLS